MLFLECQISLQLLIGLLLVHIDIAGYNHPALVPAGPRSKLVGLTQPFLRMSLGLLQWLRLFAYMLCGTTIIQGQRDSRGVVVVVAGMRWIEALFESIDSL